MTLKHALIPALTIVCTVLLHSGCSKGSDIEALPAASISVDESASIDTLLQLPDRENQSLSGSELRAILSPLELQDREERILEEILSGNIPDFLRSMVPVEYSQVVDSVEYLVRIYVVADYLALGSDSDYILMPMTPILAQRIADTLGCVLPTSKLVDRIWSAAKVKLEPLPIPPSDKMNTVPVFYDHNAAVRDQRLVLLESQPPEDLIAGHKKDVILSRRITSNPDKVVIYGWHYLSGTPIQPVYSGHVIWYADYSHGIRLVLDVGYLNGEPVLLRTLFQDPILYTLISDEVAPLGSMHYSTDPAHYP